MKDFLDEINSLRLEYPELEPEWDYILDICLTEIENGEKKKDVIFICRGLINNLIQEDK
jgi:hypothetical protein